MAKSAEERPVPRDLLMWVGKEHYPTIDAFCEEAARLGVSKRIARPPKSIKLGEALLFLAHDEGNRITCQPCAGTGVLSGTLHAIKQAKDGEGVWKPVEPRETREFTSGEGFHAARNELYKASREQERWDKDPSQEKCHRCRGWGKFPDGKIFGYVRIAAVELVLDTPAAAKEYADRLAAERSEGDIEITPVVGGEGYEEARGCGFRKTGGYYLVSSPNEDREELRQIVLPFGTEVEVLGTFVRLKEPVDYPHHRFFGTKLTDRAEVFKK